MLTCDRAVPLLDAFRTGELDELVRAQVVSHLEGCQGCCADLSALRQIAHTLRSRMTPAPPTLLSGVWSALGDRIGRVLTDLGPLWVGFNDCGITFVSLDDVSYDTISGRYLKRLGRPVTQAKVPERFSRAVIEATEGQWSSTVPVDLGGLPVFERTVLEAMRTIPRGEVRPYAWLAAQAGSPRAVRAVGNIMNRNPIPLLLPCHRVVPSAGGIGNYAFGSAIKRSLLKREGVAVESIDEMSRRRIRYIGSDTTHIYCYPTCRDARRIQGHHQVLFVNEREAAEAGYRPCKHCRPLAVAV